MRYAWKAPLFVVMTSLSVWLVGCTEVKTRVVVNLSPAVIAQIDSITNFGDSITCGAGATSPSQGYAGLLDEAIGKPFENYCRGGDQAADMTRLWVYPNAIPALGSHQLYTVMIGTNDVIFCGSTSGCIDNWYNALEASLTWLALPAEDKQAASSATNMTGTWSPDLITGLATTGGGASLSFTVNQTVAEHRVYVAYRVWDSSATNPGTAILSVDGVPLATMSSAETSGHSIATANGTTDTIFVTSVPLGAVGSHLVSVATVGANGSKFSVQWIGVSSSNYTGNSAAPRVVIGPSPASAVASWNAGLAALDARLLTMAAALVADGMQITIAPTADALDPATDLSTTVHPNNIGHLELEQAFIHVF